MLLLLFLLWTIELSAINRCSIELQLDNWQNICCFDQLFQTIRQKPIDNAVFRGKCQARNYFIVQIKVFTFFISITLTKILRTFIAMHFSEIEFSGFLEMIIELLLSRYEYFRLIDARVWSKNWWKCRTGRYVL